ncbi:MAG: DUF6442 family protein [Lachnospiraceae bacterium]|nr:DUF6442 family protein [Lachnospiraceae bacterium]
MEKKLTDEELFAEVQANPDKVGEAEREATRRGAVLGAMICVGLCVAMFVLDGLVKKQADFGKPALLLTFGSCLYYFNGKKSHIRKDRILGIIYGILALLCVLIYIGALFI